MSELRADMAKALEAQVLQLARLRACSRVDAARAVAQTCAENLRDSRTTTMESYWKLSCEIADGLVGDMLRESA